LKSGCGRIINIAINYEPTRRPGFFPYGPSKAALESETLIGVVGFGAAASLSCRRAVGWRVGAGFNK
jgi:hypothetical protein